MPNHVTNKILFEASRLPVVLARICVEDRLDFATLVPTPPQMYRGDLGAEHKHDFACNWLSWQRENWGTKWNAYDFSSGIDGDRAFLKFDTAWSVPYPVIAAFSNAFPDMPFEHRYFDEGHNFWGIEIWRGNSYGSGSVERQIKHFKRA